MDIERLIAIIVKTVVEELARQGFIKATGRPNPPGVSNTVSDAATETAKSRKRVVSAEMVLEVARAGHIELEVASDALITPLARDTAKEKGLTIRRT